MFFSLTIAAASDLSWLDDLDDPKVVEWRDARTAETTAWIEADGLLDEITERVAEWRDAQRSWSSLQDHRSGVSVWRESQPDPESTQQDDPRKWVYRTRLRVEREGSILDVPLPAGAADSWTVCQTRLSPDGKTLLTGRALPVFDRKVPASDRQPCRVMLVDTEDGTAREIGAYRGYQGTFLPDGSILLRHLNGRRLAYLELEADGTPRTEGSPGRHYVTPVVFDDGRILRWTTQRKKSGKRRWVRLGFDDGPSFKLPPGRWGWVGAHEGRILLSTDRGGDPRRVVRIDPANPGRGSWEELLADTEAQPFQSVALHGDTLLVNQVKDGASIFYERPLDADTQTHPFPEPVSYVQVMRTLRDSAVVKTRAPGGTTTYLRDRETGAYTELRGPTLFETVFRSSEAPSADGTEVPVSWVHLAGVEPDGTAPVWLRAYGGFGQRAFTWVGAREVLWLQMGGIIATVHARGGSERGEEWHEAARRENLGRTFEDVIGAGEWFVDEGWTEPGRIVVSGSSNGGLTALASVALRPDLFGAAISHSGVLDLVDGRSMEGFWWGKEYGRPGNPEERAVLERYSPVGATPEAIPPILVVTGQEDPTVPPSHSYRLKAAWDDLPGGPVLLRVQPWTSHGHHLSQKRAEEARLEVTDTMRARARAEELAFLVRALQLDWTRVEPPPQRDPAMR